MYLVEIKNGRELCCEAGGKISRLAGSAETVPVILKEESYQVTAEESGSTFVAGAVDLVFSLPQCAPGLHYRFIVSTISATTGCSISPWASDKIMGNGLTAVADKDVINSAATDREGDAIEVVADPGGAGWFIVAVTGTWEAEA